MNGGTLETSQRIATRLVRGNWFFPVVTAVATVILLMSLAAVIKGESAGRAVHDVVNDARVACVHHGGVRSMHDAFAYEVPVVCRDGAVATVKGE